MEGTVVGVRRVHGSPTRRKRETMSDEEYAGVRPKEGSNGEWYIAMQRLFQEWMTSISPGIPTSQSLNGKDPYLPLVLYKPLSDIFIKLKELSRLHSSPLSAATHSSSSITGSIAITSGIIT